MFPRSHMTQKEQQEAEENQQNDHQKELSEIDQQIKEQEMERILKHRSAQRRVSAKGKRFGGKLGGKGGRELEITNHNPVLPKQNFDQDDDSVEKDEKRRQAFQQLFQKMECTDPIDQQNWKTDFELFDQFRDEIIDQFVTNYLKKLLNEGIKDCFVDTDKINDENQPYHDYVPVWVEIPIYGAKQYFLEIKKKSILDKIDAENQAQEQNQAQNQGSIFLPPPPPPPKDDSSSNSDVVILRDYKEYNKEAENFDNLIDDEYYTEYSDEEMDITIVDQSYHVINLTGKKKHKKTQEEIDKIDEDIRTDQRMDHH